MKIDQVFPTKTKSIKEFLIETGVGCYIPIYQRPFSWGKNNFSDYFEDLHQGVKRLINYPGSKSYLGTIIAVHDPKIATVDEGLWQELPRGSLTIIDGQQRICTTIVLIIVLHNHIRILLDRVQEKKVEQQTSQWIITQAKSILGELKKLYLIDLSSGDELYRYYPKVIRAGIDTWSRNKSDATYVSPFAKLNWEYIEFSVSKDRPESPFKPQLSNKEVMDVYKFFDTKIKDFYSNPKKYDFSDLEMVTCDNFIEEIFGYPVNEEDIKCIRKNYSGSNLTEFENLLLLIIFTRYLTEHVAITVVEPNNTVNAIIMFEALNTTGELLTALETFKPKVIEQEKVSGYLKSNNYQHIKQIDGYLDQFNKPSDKRRATNRLLVPFALSETGSKLSEKFDDQRRYLYNQYEKCIDDSEKGQSFVESLANISTFIKYGWPLEKNRQPAFHNLDIDGCKDAEDALVGFNFLRGLNHTITIAPLFRFYEHAVSAKNGVKKKKLTQDFLLSIKATVAFSALWRGAFGSTNGIDNQYRNIMKTGVKNEEQTIPPISRRPEGYDGEQSELSLINYKNALKQTLIDKGKITSKDNWVSKVSNIDVYRHSTVLARFLLFCAFHDATLSKKEKGLIEKGRKKASPFLKLENWNNSDYISIEHIAPKSGRNWNKDIYEKEVTVNTLGNLILLPKEENQVLGSKPWNHKKLLYKLLASETEEEFNETYEDFSKEGLNLSSNATDVIENSTFLTMCKSVSCYDKEWSKEIIEKRTTRLAELAWDTMGPWLWT